MIGLKTYAPNLAGALSTTADALYERQRKMMHSKLLAATPGRGPGSGIRATPETVSTMIMACMVTDSLTNLDSLVRDLRHKPSDEGNCPLTGAATFGDALVATVTDEGIAATVRAITVFRSSQAAVITFQKKGLRNFSRSTFGMQIEPRTENSRYSLEIEAHLPGEAVRMIVTDLEMIKFAEKAISKAKGTR